jgi:formylglycine-generating enzyme required for sulfatase activity
VDRACYVLGVALVITGLLSSAGSTAQAPAATAIRTRVNPKDGAEMVLIPAGSFEMGDADLTDNPRRRVILSAYWIYKNDVTVGQYRRFCNATGQQMPQAPFWGWSDDNPMVDISLEGVIAYLKWAGAYLPTEAQWEKAARGTDGRRFPWGNTWDGSRCVNSIGRYNARRTEPVGRHTDSPYGLSDMAGNVGQLCGDDYSPFFWGSAASKRVDPHNGWRGGPKVVRGGSFRSARMDYLRCGYRDSSQLDMVDNALGFRCVVPANSR